ncbi:MAG: gliding motility-associated C-terminal domain-containing protein [bacterium]|nr:gliding motility-associated C-terminal domain-containing protein [bacterium]
MNTWQGCASIADQAGNLLFYSNATTVYNKSHGVMANGTGLFANTIGGVVFIAKQPGNSNLYYIFSNHCDPNWNMLPYPNGVYYSVIDMSLAAGMGSVTTKNVLLCAPPIREKLAGTKHCNGNDIWIVIQRQFSNTFNAYLLTSTGINTVAVNSSVGFVTTQTIGIVGVLKFSASGKKIVSAVPTGTANNNTGIYELFDFDNSTGLVSNPITFSVSGGVYGCEFSPDGAKLYTSRVFGSAPSMAEVIQLDLCAGYSSVSVLQGTTSSAGSVSGSGALQLAPDGKIYCARALSSSLGVINNPNSSGIACNAVQVGQSLTPNTSIYGLPNMIAIFQKPPLIPITFTVGPQCQTAQFNSPLNLGASFGTCVLNSYTLQSLQWDFGDPFSGSANSSIISNPTHTFTSIGTYSVKLILNFGCGYGTDTLKQTVTINNSCFSIASTSITCATLGSATVTPPPIGGPFTYTWLPGSQNGTVATGLNPGTYTLLAYDPNINFTHTLTTVFTSLIPLTGNVSNSNSITCNGANTGTGSVTGLAGGSGTQSYLWTNGTSTSSVPNPTNLSAGIWSVNVTDALTGCQINQSFFISQPPPLNLVLSANTPTACAGTNIALTGTNSGGTAGYTYTWTNNAPGNTASISQAAGGTYVYTLNSTDANNCLSSKTIALNFVNNPVLSVSNVSVCPLTVGTLTVSGASTYTWNASSSLSVQGISFTDSPAISQQYTVAGTALGCTAAVTASIVLHPLPVPVLTSNSPRCNGDLLSLNASGGISYYWTGPLGFGSTNVISFVSPCAPANSGVYNLTVTSVNGCTASANTNVIVNSTPTLSALGSTVCTSQTLTLSGFANVGSSFLWSGPIGFASNQQNPVLVNPSLARTGVYLLKVSSAVGCTNLATATVSVVVPPSLTVALSSPSLCYQAFNGSPNSITLTSSGANTYTLFTPNLIGSSQMGGGTASLVSVPPPGTSITIGTATLMGSNGVCASSATSTFAVIPNPTVGINSYTPVICAGQSFTYTSFGAQSYTWSQTTPGLTTYTTYMTVANPSVTSIYSVFGGSIGCNSPTQTTTITVYPLPTVTLSPVNPMICLNDKITLSANGTGSSYSWIPVIAISNSVGTSVNANPLSTMNYSVIASANNCTTMANITVSVLPLPIPTITALSQSICLNEMINLEGFGGLNYYWKGPGEISFEGKTVNLLASNLIYGGIYTLTVQDISFCRNSTSIPITINNLPNGALLGLKENGCVPLCSDYIFSSSGSSGVSSTWEINNQIIAGDKFSYCFNQAGSFTITGRLYDPQSTCKSSIDFYVTVKPKPEADFQYTPLKPIENLDEVIFTNTSKGEKQIQWNWYFNDNRGYKSKTENTSYLYANAGEYPVAFIVRNTWGCMDTVMKTIIVEPDFAIYVPNAFTPNEDDRNEVFMPVIRSAKNYNMKIYDRWGEKIFESSDTQKGWDGSFKGASCKQDVYTWKIVVSATNGGQRVMTGSVMLMR